MIIREATSDDWPAIWDILEPVFRAGETYAVDPDISQESAHAMWIETPRATFVAEDGDILGTYYIKTNFAGNASHICNCGYVTSAGAQGQGIAGKMCAHSLQIAPDLGYTAMQYNLVLASNTRAVALWRRMGFEVIGMLPRAFNHPAAGCVDAYIMWKSL